MFKKLLSHLEDCELALQLIVGQILQKFLHILHARGDVIYPYLKIRYDFQHYSL